MPDPSFLTLDKVSEYFSSTLARVRESPLDRFEVVRINGAGYDEVEEEEETLYELALYVSRGNDDEKVIRLTVESYDDAMRYVQPFLPETQFFRDEIGEYWLCSYTPSNRYKRSLDSCRYVDITHTVESFLRISSTSSKPGVGLLLPGNYKRVANRSLEAAYKEYEDTLYPIQPLSPHLALGVSGKSGMDKILYHNIPIAVVDYWGRIVIHPKYSYVFSKFLKKHGEVVCER